MRKAWWTERKLWLGIICSAIFLFLAFRKVQWAELAKVLHAVDWATLFLAAALYVLSLMVRGWCWQALLAPLGPVTAKETFTYVNIGYLANGLLPLRAGEVIRAVLLSEKRCFSKSAVLATIVVERLLDVLTLVALTLLLMLAMPIPPAVKQSALVAGIIGCLGLIGVWRAAGRPLTVLSGERLPRWLPTRVALAALALGRSFGRGLTAVRSVKQAAAAVCYSLLSWALVCGSIYLMLLACQLRLPWHAALMVMVVVNLGAIIPSTPGAIGVAHFLAILALSPWVVEREMAVGFSIVFHAMPFLVTIGLGGACLWKERIEIGRVNKVGMEAVQ